MKRTLLAVCLLAVISASVPSVAGAANRIDPGYVPPGTQGPPPPPVGSDNCTGPTPPVMGALPFTDGGTTCQATNGVTNYGGPCGIALPFPYGGEDVIYQFTPGGANSIAFSMSLTGSAGDLALFVITTCGNGATCVANSQDAIGPGTGPETIAATSYAAGVPHFVYVDSYYNAGSPGSCGTYTLTATGTLPAELMEMTID